MSFIILVLIATVLVSLLFIFNFIMRNYLKVEKPKFLSYNHVNEKHKEVDWTIRTISIIIIIITFTYISINADAYEKTRGYQ